MKLTWKMNFVYMMYLKKHKNHNIILKIKEHHGDVPSFDFKPVAAFNVEFFLKRLKINEALGNDHMPPKMVKMCSNELSVTLMELLKYAFKHKRFPDEIKQPLYLKRRMIWVKKIIDLLIFSKVFVSIIAEQLMEYSKAFLMICCVPIEKSMNLSMY